MVVTTAVAFGGGAPPTAAQDAAALSIQKVTNASTVQPGEAFTYTIQVQCSTAAAAGCVDATVTDPLPPYIEQNGAVTVTGSATPPVVDDGPPITVTFDDDLGGGATGLAAGQIVTITVPVVVDPTIPPSENGVPIDNTATVDATNAAAKESTATVTPEVPVTIAVDTSKSYSPDSQVVGVTDPITLSLSATNTSNVPVDTLVVQDPPDDPPAQDATNPFLDLVITGVGTPALPPNADEVTIEVYDPTAPGWVEVAPGATPPTGANGVRYTFVDTTGDGIQPGATTDIDLTLIQRGTATPPVVVANVVEASVDRDGDTATDQGTDSFNIRASTLDVTASKSIEPASMNAGESATVTLGGKNGPTDPLTSMTITEPADQADNPFVGENPVVFTGFGTVQWPADADTATITYECNGSPVAPIPTTTVDTLPAPPGGCDPVTGFSVEFTAADPAVILPDAEAVIEFTIDTPETQTDGGSPVDELTRPNLVRVDGTDGISADTAFARDTLVTIVDRLDVVTEKTVTPESAPGWPGQVVIVELEGQVLPFPVSTVDADVIVVQDPATIPAPWFEAFGPQSVTATPVPACSTLTVEYTTSAGEPAGWATVPGMVFAGPTIVNEAFPDDVAESATGIRFVYTPVDDGAGPCEDGFPPGTTVAPNLAFGIRPGGPADDPDVPVTFDDCADTSADAATVEVVVSPEACDDVLIEPVPEVGELDPIDKTWDRDLLTARSQQRSGVTIRWSTEGFSGLEAARISDIPDPAGTELTESVYDTFDLIRLDAITSTMDPHLTYDQVMLTEFFQVASPGDDPSTGTWVQASNDPCLGTSAAASPPDPCDGAYPGITVPIARREVTLGVRLTYVESPTRGDRLSAGAPPVGSGVAASDGNDRRIHPVFELRDVLRSDDQVPVIEDNLYNTATPGEIDNEAMLETVFDLEDEPYSWTDNDTIAIVDVPVTVNATKDWAGGPLGIPPTDPPVDQADYPRSLVTLTGTNTTPAKLDELVIADDTAGDMFEWFNLTQFTIITPPGDIGDDDTDVVVTLDRGGTTTDYTRAEALALVEADLDDVTDMVITYSGGRINVADTDGSATATVQFAVRLRTEGRVSGTPPTEDLSPVDNQVTVTGSDLVDIPEINIPNPDNWTAEASADAEMGLTELGLVVSASKSITPATLTEPATGPVTVTIGGRPSGGGDPPLPPPTRAAEMVLVDDDPRLFNQYDLVSLDDITFTAPIDQVQVDALTGGTWELDGFGAPTVTGATWQIGVPTTGPGLSLPAGVLPADVQGLRFTFTRVDGAQWEDPTTTPNQTVSFQVERRANLNIDADGVLDTTPVPVDLPGFNDPAPGETVAGMATNTSTAQAFSIVVDDQRLESNIAEATDTIEYLHADNAVQVRKTTVPAANIPPGQPFTYVLTATNTGDVDITDPVITDSLPVDGSGPIVVLADSPNYSYEITGGSGMPTDPALVTETDDSANTTDPTITFTFPDGSTLPVGATYTIEFDVVPRAGYPADTAFTNEFGIVGDRPWDECDGDPSDVVDPETGECLAEVDNELSVAGAMSVSKLVQADGSDELGLTTDPAVTTADPADCVADVDGFSARPCVPIAEPGGEITWRLQFVNSGNLDIDRILGIDQLPAIGDTLATVPAIARGSEWSPTFSGDRPVLADPTFGTLNVWYTTDEPASCDAVAPTVADDSAAPPNLLCPDLAWVAWPEGDPLPIDPAGVTGLQVEILPGPGTRLAPAATVDVDVTMLAPAFDPNADYTATQAQPDVITYNTVGTTGRIVNDLGAPTSYTLPSEPPRVGVALANGPLGVLKTVDGDASQWAPASFSATLSCVSAGEDVPLPDDVAQLTLVPGEAQVIENLPWGADCTLSEETDQGQTSATSTTATVGRDDQLIRTVELVNVYDDAPLTIEKVVDSDAVDADGVPVAYGPFTVTVDCSFLDSPVYADGYGPTTPMTFVLDDGDSVTLTGLPVGASCAIEETDAKGATTSIEVVAGGDETTDDGTSTTVELPDGDVDVTVTNSYEVGSVAIEKVVDGNTDAPGAAGPFVIAMTCTLVDESGTRVVYDGEVILGGTNPLEATVGDIAVGARCEFVETDVSAADASTIEPADGVIVGAGTVETVTVTNTYTTGSVRLVKVVTGNPAAPGASGPFTLSMVCTLAGEFGTTATVYDDDVVLGGGNPLSATVDGLPTGAVCVVTEDDPGLATPTVSPAGGVVVGDGTTVTVTVTNFFQVTPLPPTGGSVGRSLQTAAIAVVIGAAALVVTRRRRTA